MKKLFAIFVVLAMTAGTTFGQHLSQANVNQYDGNHTAIVSQIGVTQHAPLIANVNQWGSENLTTVNQTTGNVTRSTANVTQTGTENTAAVTHQHGQDHLTNIYQEGYKNEATTIQDNTNTVTNISQTGNYNRATVDQQRNYQFGGLSQIDLSQVGNNNEADIEQDGLADGQAGDPSNLLNATQWGNSNKIDVTQYRGAGEGDLNNAYIWQQGDGNVVLLEQAETPSDANITQLGTENRIGKTNSDFDWLWDEKGYQAGSKVGTYQSGYQNIIGLYQVETFTDNIISQTGEYNATMLFQDNGGIANVSQIGAGHTAHVYQQTPAIP